MTRQPQNHVRHAGNPRMRQIRRLSIKLKMLKGLALLICCTLWACDSGVPPITEAPTFDSEIFSARDFSTSTDGSIIGPDDVGNSMGGCDPNPCENGDRCIDDGDMITCEPISCELLECGENERCEEGADGRGRCLDLSCSDDLDCAPEEFCDEVCVPDVCEAGTRVCMDNSIVQCLDDGSGELALTSCSSESSGFESVCIEPFPGSAFCSCLDNWDCPHHMLCESGLCTGSPNAPTCQLEPADFSESLPSAEITWGGRNRDDRRATGSPFSLSAQAVMTPLVANLDDDNGDGLVNAQDIPEIVFITFCNSDFSSNGVLRAIHGGGPSKGQDFFAVLGEQVWHEGDPLPDEEAYTCREADLDSTAGLAIGDLDDPQNSDGRPEIVAIKENDGLSIYDNHGNRLTDGLNGRLSVGPNPTVSIANLDGQGMAEIIVGNIVFTVERQANGELSFLDVFEGAANLGLGRNGQGAISCVADLTPQPGLEIAGGSTVYRWPSPPAGAQRRAQCSTQGGGIQPTNLDEEKWCDGELIKVWDGREVNGPDATKEGFCAIADVLGADVMAPPGPLNPLDGQPELILIANGRLQIYNAQTGTLGRNINIVGEERGGAPNVDDFDGDGFPEIGSAFAQGYMMLDLQPPTANCPAWPEPYADGEDRPEENPVRTPGPVQCQDDSDCAENESVCNHETNRCVCLHNGWTRETEDNSSRVTGSTLFDFNGDGAAEVIYNDECWFRIYDGLDGTVLLKEASESRTRIEYPIVADVDNDGNAEIVFTTSNESGFCSENLVDQYNNGLEVWGDPNDRWVSARRIWNQHAYHITQVTEDGSIPTHEPPSWESLNGRFYNTYRSQPRSRGVAPDLVITDINVRPTGDGCGALGNSANITVLVKNKGDLRVGPDIAIGFEGQWESGESAVLLGADNAPVRVSTQVTLEPGDQTRLTVTYDSMANGDNPDSLPAQITARVDVDGNPSFGRERECREDNNSRVEVVEAPTAQPDLRIDDLQPLSRTCPEADLIATVSNHGQQSVSDVVLRFYAGDPRRGGGRLDQIILPGPIEPGTSEVITHRTQRFPGGRRLTVYAVVDPDNAIEECREDDNLARAENAIECINP